MDSKYRITEMLDGERIEAEFTVVKKNDELITRVKCTQRHETLRHMYVFSKGDYSVDEFTTNVKRFSKSALSEHIRFINSNKLNILEKIKKHYKIV